MKEEQKIRRYCQLKRNRGDKPKFLLTEQEVKTKLDEANITIWDVGIGKGKYQLCRYQDKGVYTVDNCEFKTHHQNNSEKKRIKNPVEIEGIYFESIAEAGRHFNMKPQSVTTRLDSKNFHDWKRLTEKRVYNI